MSELGVIWIFFWLDLWTSVEAAVDCGGPVYNIVTDQGCIEIGSVFPPPSTIEGSNYTIPCQTLLVRTEASIDYCPVGVCQPNGTWTVTSLSCGSSECSNGSSTNYIGRRVCTISGRTCQSWATQTPHSHPYTTAASFPDSTIASAGSYCRDPTGVRGSPWCYTTDPEVEWETCDIPNCADIGITQGTCTNNYCGDPETTAEVDNLCTSAHVPAFTRSAGSTLKSFCTSILEGVVSSISYCPVLRCQPDSTWTGSLRIACGENECYDSINSDLYAGGRSCTENGWACQSWDVQSPHSHPYSLPGVGGHCRDPTKVRGKPWCFTTNPAVEWEFCDIPECSNMTLDQGTCTTTTSTSATSSTLDSTTVTTTTITASTPTTATSSTTTAAPVSPGIPVPGQKYQLTQTDVDGYSLQYTVPNSVSRVRCGQHCSQQSTCVFFTVGSDGTCTLYEADALSTDKIFCSSPNLKCFERV